MPEVLIVPTGTANIASVSAAFRRLGAGVRVAERGREIQHASHVMLPGVGAFGAAMARLRGNGFVERLADRIRADQPTICICVGHQLLFEASEESPGERGLGVVRGTIARCPHPDHEDCWPSCAVRARLWFCNGCSASGSIIDLGALVYDLEPRGAGFHRIREQLLAALGIVEEAA